MTRKPPAFSRTIQGHDVEVSDDGGATITTCGVLEIVLDQDGIPKIAGVTGCGIEDLAEVDQITTQTVDNERVFSIGFRGGGTATVKYVIGVFGGVSTHEAGLTIRKNGTSVYLTNR